MLVRFAVQNYLSFNERTEFNMLTGSPRRLPHHVYHYGDLELLKMAAVYGANGAGKSNFNQAIKDLTHLIDIGTISFFVNRNKFRLNSQKRDLPICFEIEFLIDNTMFFYNISVNNSIILEEQLLVIQSNDTEKLIFKRTYENGKIKILLDKEHLKSEQDKLRVKLYEEELLNNSEVLLSKLSESREGFEIVKKAHNWFSNVIFIHPNLSISNLILSSSFVYDFVKKYINKFDTGINDFEVFTYPLEQFFGANNQELKEQVKEKLNLKNYVDLNEVFGWKNPKIKAIAIVEKGEYVVKKLLTYHLDNKKEKISFEPTEESDGTVRLWDLLTALYLLQNAQCLVLIDEIDSSVHPSLLKELITKFSENKETKGQLIFTTHESNLLDQEIFRQDEIWFAEKNKEGATELFPLSDFDIRYDLDIRKGYLNGRFGAIPFLSNFKDLNWKAHAE